MVPTDEEIEATMAKSRELSAQVEKLTAEALDPAKDLGKLKDAFDQELQKFVTFTKQPDAPIGTGLQSLMLAVETIADFGAVEVAAAEGLAGKDAGTKGAPGAPNSGAMGLLRSGPPRRGVRI
jgi:hypothetical protein